MSSSSSFSLVFNTQNCFSSMFASLISRLSTSSSFLQSTFVFLILFFLHLKTPSLSPFLLFYPLHLLFLLSWGSKYLMSIYSYTSFQQLSSFFLLFLLTASLLPFLPFIYFIFFYFRSLGQSISCLSARTLRFSNSLSYSLFSFFFRLFLFLLFFYFLVFPSFRGG